MGGISRSLEDKRKSQSQSQLQEMLPAVASGRKTSFCLGNAFLSAETATPPEGLAQAYAPGSPSSNVMLLNSARVVVPGKTWPQPGLWVMLFSVVYHQPQLSSFSSNSSF